MDMMPIYENIPPLLQRLNRWVMWKYEERKGKKTKPPYVPAAWASMSSGSLIF